MVVEFSIEKLKTQVDQIKTDLIFLQQEASKNIVDSKKTEELEKEVNKVKADIQKELDELK
jgi:archaellum component FlaC